MSTKELCVLLLVVRGCLLACCFRVSKSNIIASLSDFVLSIPLPLALSVLREKGERTKKYRKRTRGRGKDVDEVPYINKNLDR